MSSGDIKKRTELKLIFHIYVHYSQQKLRTETLYRRLLFSQNKSVNLIILSRTLPGSLYTDRQVMQSSLASCFSVLFCIWTIMSSDVATLSDNLLEEHCFSICQGFKNCFICQNINIVILSYILSFMYYFICYLFSLLVLPVAFLCSILSLHPRPTVSDAIL